MPSFVSYCRQDRLLVVPLVAVLRLGDADAFRDEDSIPPGKEWAKVIAAALEISDRVLVMWTEAAAKSENVAAEYSAAIRLKKDVVPVLLDDTDLPDALKGYQWIDFRPFVEAACNSLVPRLARAAAAAAVGVSIAGPVTPGLIAWLLLNGGVGGERLSFSDEAATRMREIFNLRVASAARGEA